MALIKCRECNSNVSDIAVSCPNCGAPVNSGQTMVVIIPRNRIIAIILAFLLGGFGIHKFYLGRVGWGIVYILFCWTGIPSFVAFIEGLVYILMGEDNFNSKYNPDL